VADPTRRTLYATTAGGGHGPADRRSAIVALDAATGRIRWHHPSPPGIAGAFVPGCALGRDGSVYAAFRTEDGRRCWLATLDRHGRGRWQAALEGASAPSRPVCGPDGAVYCSAACNSDAPGNVWRLSAADGTVSWRASVGGRFPATPAPGPDGLLWVRHERGLLALEQESGAEARSVPLGEGTGAAAGPEGTVCLGAGPRLLAFRFWSPGPESALPSRSLARALDSAILLAAQ